MDAFLGIDYGTGSVKALLWDVEASRVLGIGAREISYAMKTDAVAEQDPTEVLQRALEAVRLCLSRADVSGREVKGISFSGQMHGTVIVDGCGRAASRVITWEDGRATPNRVREMLEKAPSIAEKSGCGLAKGFLATTAWRLHKEDPQALKPGHRLLLPGDWLRSAMSAGAEPATDPSNGSSSGLFDTARRTWHVAACEELGLDPSLLPAVQETTDRIGELSAQAAKETGLAEGTPLYVGGGDQPLSMMGSGIGNESAATLVNVGTGSQIAAPSQVYRKSGPLIVFCFPGAGFSVLGAGLSGGAALRWLKDIAYQAASLFGGLPKASDYELLSEAANQAPPGADGAFFLPFLDGARHKPDARACFTGLRSHHTFSHLARAVMEGVLWELKWYEGFFGRSPSPDLILAGGGMSSPVWSQMASSLFGRPARRSLGAEQAALGAALIAGVGAGAYPTIDHAAAAVPMDPHEIIPEHKDVYARLAENLPWELF